MLSTSKFLLGAFLSVLLCLFLVVSVEAEAITWSWTYGAGIDEWGYCVVETLDGGFALVGSTDHVDGGGDIWLVKTDKFGNIEWEQAYQGSFGVGVFSLIATSDGGYAITSDVSSDNYWLMKTDSSGNMEWNRTYGESDSGLARSVVEASDGGFIVVGSTYSLLTDDVDCWVVKTDSSGNMEWNKTYGGAGDDWGDSLVKTSEGGYAIGGLTRSFGFEDSQFWLIKTDIYGNVEWNRTCGGTGNTGGGKKHFSMFETSDGGYAMVSKRLSDDSRWDFLVVKTDASGNVTWTQTYGRERTEWPGSMVASSDGGCVIAGFTNTIPTAGMHDYWVVKVDALGNLEWDHTYGGGGYDAAESIVAVSEGGYAIAGVLNGGSTGDFWLVKTDEFGNVEWSRTYGKEKIELANSVVEAPDGGYVIVGETPYFGEEDGESWLIKTDVYGGMEWSYREAGTAYGLTETANGDYAISGHTVSSGPNGADFWFWLVGEPETLSSPYSQTYGGTETDIAYSLVEASDRGFAIAGFTESFGAGDADFWLVKTDAYGNMEWNQTCGGTETEKARSLVATSNGGYAIVGFTESSGAGASDFWLVKTDGYGNVEWNQTYGGPEVDVAYSLVETSDGGYAMCGETGSFGAGALDFWLVKTDELGNMVWNKTFGGTFVDVAYSLVETSDGGFALAGFSEPFSDGSTCAWLVKTDMFGDMEWNVTYGEYGKEGGHSLIVTSDGGFALAGYTTSFNNGYDFWLIKTDEFGYLADPVWIPEAAWVVPPLLVTATIAIVISKKKLVYKRPKEK